MLLLCMQSNQITIYKGHTCDFNEVAARANDIEERILRQCQELNSTVSLVQAYRAAIANESEIVIAALRTPKQMKSKLGKRRRKHQPPMPALLENIVIPQELANLVYPDNIHGGPAVVKRFFQEKLVIRGLNNRVETSLIFATDDFMKILFKSKNTYADGTFYIAPARFKQVYFCISYLIVKNFLIYKLGVYNARLKK